MKRTFILAILLLFFAAGSKLFAQLTGTKNIPGDYPALAAAIADLNTQGVGAGGVTLNLLAGNPEIAPPGGYAITATGTAANNIVIQGNSNLITASPALTAGTLTDAIFKIIGGDYIGITGFVMQENPANTITTSGSNNMTEWGVALLYASATDGAQNNAVVANTISLNRSYTNTWGVYSNTRHTATAVGTTADITALSGSNSNNKVYSNIISNVNYGIAFIGSGTAALQDQLNDIGGTSALTGNTVTNWGGFSAAGSYISNPGASYCILSNHQVNDNISYNSITSAAVSGTSVTFRGISKDYTATVPVGTFTTTITNNTITMSSGFTSGTYEHIRSSGITTALPAATINISNNTLLNSSMTGAASSSSMIGIINTSIATNLTISGNVIRGFTSTATTGGFTGISNIGNVVNTIAISNNQVGNASGNAITFSAATSASILGISSIGAANTCTVTINANDFRGIVNSVTASSVIVLIASTGPTLSNNITNNTFTNLTLNTTGTTTLINHSYTMPAGGSTTISGNSIVTALSRTGVSGSLTLTSTSASSPNGTTANYTNNNFSNITVSGTSTITGLNNTDGLSTGTSVKTVTGNTLSNWTGGTGAILCMNISYWNGVNSITGNTISGIAGQGAITGMSINASANSATSMTFSGNTVSSLVSGGTGGTVVGITCSNTSPGILFTQNTVNTLSSTGTSAVNGIVITGANASGTSVTRNKIYDLSSSNASGTVNGILVSGGTLVNVSNNLVGDLRTTAANAANPLNGINVTGSTTTNLYYNTVYLNATSSGALFGSSGISVSTTPTVDMRNNLVVNLSTTNGAAFTTAYRRSTTTLTTYASTSNNNSFYAGTPSATNVIFYDGTNSDQTLSAYQTRVAVRDNASVTVNPTFTSTVGSNAGFLHIPAATNTALESGGTVIGTITIDYDNDSRPGPVGSVNGGALAPDIGADEFDGIPSLCVGTPTAGTAAISPASRCGSGTFTLTLSGASSGPGITYQWQSAAVSGGPYTNIPGATTTSFVTGTISSTTYFVCQVTCTNSSQSVITNEVTGTVFALPSVAVTPVSASFCYPGGTPVALTASGASTYSWSPSSGLSATTGASVNASPSVTTTYTVTGTDGNGCVNTAVTSITSNPAVTNASAAASPATICAGSTTSLSSTADPYQLPIFSENFNSGAPSWTRTNTSTGGTPANAAWTDRPDGYVYNAGTPYHSNDNSQFVQTNSDAQGSGGTARTTLQSPAFSTVGYTNITVKFYQYYRDINDNGDSAVVEASLDAVNWSRITQYTATSGSENAFTQQTVNLPAAYNNQAAVYVRFRYIATWDWYWSIDNVSVTGGSMSPYIFTWSSTPSGFSSSVQNPGSTSPATSTTYSVVITNPAGCSATASTAVTVNALPTVTATSSSSPICSGSNTSLTGSGASTYAWMPGSLSGTTVSVSPASTTTYTVTGTDANGCSNTGNVTVTVNTLPAVTATASSSAICNGSSASLTGSGASTYSWMPGSLSGTTVSVSPASTTTYTVTGTDANGCTNTGNVTVTVNALPTVTATAGSSAICSGSSTSLTGSGASTYAWMPGSLSGTTVSVSPATTTTYTVTGTDANGCVNTGNVTVTVNALPTVTATASSSTICNGSSTSLTGSGASTYAWMPGSLSGTTVSVSPTSTTTYTVTGTDANGCANTGNVTVTVNALPTVSATAASSTICSGSNTSLTGSGASTYSWMPGSLSGTTVTVSPASTTTYTVTGTDANGCANTGNVTVTVNPLPTVAISASSTSICVGNTVTLTGSGASSYSWMPGSLTGTVISVTPASTTTYTVTGTDANGCVNTATQTINVGSQPTVTAVVTPTAICVGSSATLTGSGASTYTWMPGSLTGSSVTVSPTTNTTYTVTGVVSAGCQNTATVTLVVNTLPVVSISGSSTFCTGGSTTLTGSSGGSSQWYLNGLAIPGATSNVYVATTAGVYNMTKTNLNGCVDSSHTSFVVTELPLPNVTATSGASVICSGGSTTLTASGASTYTWMPGSLSGSPVTVTPASNTTYTVTGTGANGCMNTATVAVNLSPTYTVSVSSQTNVSCNGGSNGSATIAASGGTGTLSYAWAPSGGNAATASSLSFGTYTCTVTDAIGCTTTQTVSITQPAAISSSVSSLTSVSCNGGNNGSASISAGGGTGTLTYAWAPSGGTASSASGLSAGNYTVTITDANSCTHTQTLAVTQPSAITSSVSSQINVSCNGGNNASASISASGGTGTLTYAWSPSGGNAASASGLSAGTYTVTITDANSCTRTQTLTITQPSAITSSVSAQTNVSCNGGSNGAATISAGGGTGILAYSWAPSGGNASSASGLSSGVYTVTITDANTCTHTQTLSITQPVAVAGTVVSVTNATCGSNNGAATVSASGGTGTLTYAWAPSGGNATTATGLGAGAYTVTVTDANGCTGTIGVAVSNAGAATVTVASQTNVSCNGGNNGAASVNATGGTGTLSYNWTPGNPAGDGTNSVTGLVAGTWTCTVTDQNGCITIQTVTITEPSAITSFVASQTNVSCNGGNNGTATLSASGGTGTLSYSWSSGSTTNTESSLAAGSYTCTITDANGCVHTQVVTITEPSLITTAVDSVNNASCFGIPDGNAGISASGGTGTLSYSWSPSGGTGTSATGLGAGTYTVTVTDVNGCTAAQTLAVTEPAQVSVIASASDTTVCAGTLVTLTGSGTAASYAWDNGVFDGVPFSAMTTTTYILTGTDASGCQNTDTLTINVNSLPTVAANASAINVCEGTMITLTGSGSASSYSWTGGASDGVPFAATTSTTYTVTGTDANGCSDTASIFVNVNAVPVVGLGPDQAVCSGPVVLDAQNPGDSYLWSDNSTGQTLSVTVSGVYWVDVTNSSGCTSRDSVTVTINANPVVALGNDTAQCGGSLTLDAQNPGAFYLWSDNSTNQTLTVTASGIYYVTVTYTGGCQSSDTISVTINTPPVVTFAMAPDTICKNDAPLNLSGAPAGGTFSGPGVSGNTFDPFTLNGLQTIVYSYTDANGCSATATDSIFVDPCTGIAENLVPVASVYPNPNLGLFTLDLGYVPSGNVKVEITNSIGQLVDSFMMHTNIMQVNLGLEEGGVYFVKIIDGNSVSVIRVVKQ